MTKYTSAWGRPIQGVSQQSAQVRLPGQCTAQENGIPSVVDGLIKRWGTEHIARLMGPVGDGLRVHFYNRGDDEQYFMLFQKNLQPRVFSSEGVEASVSVEGSWDYVLSDNPKDDLSILTVSDTTFISNARVIPRASSQVTPGLTDTAIVSCQFAEYGRNYVVVIDDIYRGSYKTPDGDETYHINFVDTTYVTTELLKSLETSINGNTDYQVEQHGNALWITKADGTRPRIYIEDGRDGGDLVAVIHRVSKVANLPTNAPEGYLVEVVGEGSESDDDYWLVASSYGSGNIKWTETTAPNQSTGLDPSTMPHVLVRTGIEGGVAQFTLRPADWENREVGTEESNKMPPFVEDGVPIQHMGVFQNRLYVTSGQNVTFTQSNYFFNFFRRTTRTNLDDQRCSTYADTDDISYLTNGCILDGDLVFFSNTGQFMLRGDQVMTYENVNLRLVSQYKSTLRADPAASGNVVFFPFQYGNVSGMRELYTDTYTDTKRARPISDHVKGYIGGEIVEMTTSTNLNTLLVRADAKDTLYTYNWQFDENGQDRAQSAWATWTFRGGYVRFVHFDRDLIYLLIERSGEGLYLEMINTGDPDTEGLDFPLRLDRVHSIPAHKVGDRWEFQHTVPAESFQEFVVVHGPDCNAPGAPVDVQGDGSTLWTLDNLSSDSDQCTLYVGEPYTFLYEPTPPFIKDQNGAVIGTDRLTIQRVLVNYDAIGEVEVAVRNSWGVERAYRFNGRRVGQFDNLVGFTVFQAGQFTFPVRQLSNRATYILTSKSHVPFTLRGMEWEGAFNQKGRRI